MHWPCICSWFYRRSFKRSFKQSFENRGLRHVCSRHPISVVRICTGLVRSWSDNQCKVSNMKLSSGWYGMFGLDGMRVSGPEIGGIKLANGRKPFVLRPSDSYQPKNAIWFEDIGIVPVCNIIGRGWEYAIWTLFPIISSWDPLRIECDLVRAMLMHSIQLKIWQA